MKTLRTQFEEFMEATYGPAAALMPPEQRRQLEDAFMGGAVTALAAMDDSGRFDLSVECSRYLQGAMMRAGL